MLEQAAAMRDQTHRDDSIYARPKDRPTERLVDLPEAHYESPRATRRTEGGPARDADSGIQRVGSRSRIRPEVLIAIVGPLFIVAALLKPWSVIPAPAHGSAPPSDGTVALASAMPRSTASPSTSAEPSPVGWPDIPPGDYRFPQENLPPLDSTTGSAAVDAQGWGAVDWTLLYLVDQHNAWGFGSASIPDQTDVPAGVPTATPDLGWIPAQGQPSSTILTVSPGSGLYAIDVTWPATVKATGVRFTYLQDPAYPASMTPAGFLPASEVSPLSATVVAWAGVASPFGPAVTPAAVGPVHTEGGTLRSGQFWIAPPAASPKISPATPPTAIPAVWHSSPWRWPVGEYRVTIDTTSGVVAFLVMIQQAG